MYHSLLFLGSVFVEVDGLVQHDAELCIEKERIDEKFRSFVK